MVGRLGSSSQNVMGGEACEAMNYIAFNRNLLTDVNGAGKTGNVRGSLRKQKHSKQKEATARHSSSLCCPVGPNS